MAEPSVQPDLEAVDGTPMPVAGNAPPNLQTLYTQAPAALEHTA